MQSFENRWYSFQGKTVFITGASRGIGKCIKENFEASGAQVIAPGRSQLDLSSPASVKAYIEQNQPFEVDVFVHCAGFNRLSGICEMERRLLEQVFEVNVYSAISLLHEMVPHMQSQRWGRILLISSVYAMVSRERRIAYTSSKHALTGLAKTLTLELAPDNILTNCVAPGYVLTDMTKQNLSEVEIQEIQTKIPTGRFQTEQDVADCTLFLCSDWNQSITGQVIAVDGGFVCR